ncbi:MAG: hypothetical protein R3B67_03110 [Phycisphaerales bacterium]
MSASASRDDFNYDAEAVFTVGDDVFVLSKNRSNTGTDLYLLIGVKPGVINPLRAIGALMMSRARSPAQMPALTGCCWRC